jgi:hypothetical protein
LSSAEPGTDATLAVEEYDDDLAVARLAWLAHEDRTALDQACDRCLSSIEVDLVNDWWQAHEAGAQPVIYAHRRALVDQLNQVCQRLRAEAGQLGSERLAVGDRSFAVGDLVVLGANAKDRLGVVNGTTATVVALDVRDRTMTVRTLEDDPPRTVRLPAGTWTRRSAPGSPAGSTSPTPGPTCVPRGGPSGGRCWR